MIESPEVADWKELQQSVFRLLNEVGLTAQVEVVLETPRGKVEVDVLAVDERSVEKIRYIVECKCWSTAIPQHVVHSFTTVMLETGANIGFIVSKFGLQAGAERYTKSTNIIGLTFEALQQRYFKPWWINHFCPIMAAHAEKVCFYTEPFNITRNKALENFSAEKLEAFKAIQHKYAAFSMIMWHSDLQKMIPDSNYGLPVPSSIEEFKRKTVEVGEHLAFKSVYWRDLLEEICTRFNAVEEDLHGLFGRDIFTQN